MYLWKTAWECFIIKKLIIKNIYFPAETQVANEHTSEPGKADIIVY